MKKIRSYSSTLETTEIQSTWNRNLSDDNLELPFSYLTKWGYKYTVCFTSKIAVVDIL